MTDQQLLLKQILDIGVAMIQSGAETHRVEDSLYRLCESFGFSGSNIWVIPSNIQATVLTQADESITQIRHIRRSGVDFARLDALNSLCRWACAERPDTLELARRFDAVAGIHEQPPWQAYLGGVLAGAGFGVFFNCDALDAVAAAAVSLLVTFLTRRISRMENNPLVLNFSVSFLAELLILLGVRVGFGHHVGYIAAGVVMLLISALGTTNGVRDLVHLDTLSGVMNISLSLTGAIGIALGIGLPLKLFLRQGSNEIMVLNPSIPLELLACTIGCIGFALWFRVKGKHILCCALGAALTWCAYLGSVSVYPSNFCACIVGAVICGLYAQGMARVEKAPATVFQTVAIFPIIPGAALYYTMYGLVMADLPFAWDRGLNLALSCFGIVLGFMLVEVLSRALWPQKRKSS